VASTQVSIETLKGEEKMKGILKGVNKFRG